MYFTVQIICNNGNPNGHGVICKIAEQYYIITCTHIIHASPTIGDVVHIKFDNNPYTTTILKFLPQNLPLEECKPYDLCLLQWDNIPPKIQNTIYILPFKLQYQPSAVTLNVLSGHLQKADNTCHGLHHFACDNRTLSGDSGSPLILTENGKEYWIALHDARDHKKDLSDGQNIFRSYAIPSYWIVSFFPEILQEQIKKELISSEQDFYHPLQIGQKIFKQDKDDRKIPVYEFPHVPENAESVKHSFEIKKSDIFKKQWLQNKTGIFMLLGEPGGGKTTFLRQWSQEIIDQGADIIPLYIPLREQDTNDFAKFILHSYDNINATSCFSTDTQSSFRFIYLIDGLDEIDDKAQSEWLDRLNKLSNNHALCIITCRTAYYQQTWQTANLYYLMGLFAHEKKKFLTEYATIKYGDKDKKNVADWLNQWLQLIKTNPIVGHLSGSPLLLSLMAYIYNPDNYASLSDLKNDNLADMYHNIVKGLIKQRKKNVIIENIKNILGLLAQEAFEKNNSAVFLSDRLFSAHLFNYCSSNNIPDEKCKDYKEVILASSIIKEKKKDYEYEWLHKTFMEYAYALYIKERWHIDQIIKFFEDEWDKNRCHHVLILLWGMLDTSERSKIAGKIRDGYDDTYEKSPLRFILHLYGKSNVCIKEYDPLYREVKSGCREELKLALSADEHMPSDILEILAQDDNEDVRRNVAENPNTPLNVLEILAQDGDESVLIGLALNSNTPPDVLEILAQYDADSIQISVAQNPNTSSHILEHLAKDNHNEDMQSNIASHPNTPSHILEILAHHDDEYVRWTVARHPNTPSHILEILAKDNHNEDMRSDIASHPNTPSHILEHLADDYGYYGVVVRVPVANNPNTPSHILEHLAEDVNESVRRYVAKNPNTPQNILEHLAQDHDENVRQNVTFNPKIPLDVLKYLAKDDDFGVRWWVTKNPNSHLEWYL